VKANWSCVFYRRILTAHRERAKRAGRCAEVEASRMRPTHGGRLLALNARELAPEGQMSIA
jgi:hypothetical protein